MKATRFWNKGYEKARLALAVALALGLATGLERAYSADAAADPAAAKISAADKINVRDKIFKDRGKVSPAEQKAAAKRARAKGLLPGVAGKAAATPIAGRAAVGAAAAAAPLAALAVPPPTGIDGPGGVPHYFGPYGNWAYSPLPMGTIAALAVEDGGSGYSATPTVTITDAYGTGTGATATAIVVNGVITGFNGIGGTGYSAPVVEITDPTGTGAIATATIGGALTGGLPKFVDKLPGLTPAGANALGQYIPLAVADTTSYPLVGTPGSANYKPASDYYEIALVEYAEKMHSNLPPTRQRGYVQLATATVPGANITLNNPDGSPILMPNGTTAARFVDRPHFLGPTIVSTSNRPVRIKFYNLLPTGAGGDLFIPVDETVMGSGMGPGTQAYKQNRATVHLHGNNTVWISDGTPHQWTTPAGESTAYPKGVSTRNVPDMDGGAAGPGVMTFYYTNAMSARLMFYHDHAMGITRLNVYAGEAAGYVITDPIEQDMINGTNLSGVNPTSLKVLPDIGIPLVIQDRTFVDANTIFAQDPTWNWGTGPRDPLTGKITAAVTGDLWTPHVYMSAQNPWDLSGMNAFGRWHYGPWFWPPTPTCVNGLPQGCIDTGPVANPYYQPVCDGLPDLVNLTCTAPWEPPMMPGTPNPSMPGEAFNDTPIVNGTAYPYLTVEPKAVRFRILNAANDRFLNLQLYVAADKTTATTAGAIGATTLCAGGFNPPAAANCTEVKMVPATGFPNQLPDTPSGVPDPTTKGPDWIQIGTEGGFLPKPAVIPSQPIGWNLNLTAFNVGNVNQRSLLLGTAERADVVVDFSAYAGKTLILYNDAPAAFPAGVPSYDYFTGNPDQLDTGGAPTTQPGYGPNTRTVMQIRVGTAVTTPTPQVTLANLNTVFAKTALKKGVFEASHEPIIMPQAAYNTAYNNTFPTTATGQYVNFVEAAKTFVPIDANGVKQATAVTLPLEPKAMHDEMGGVYDTQFGRMSGMLGLTNPNPASTAAPFLAYSYASPPTDVHLGAQAKPLGQLPDGTQIWKITHNGVDTHTIHTHLFTAQLINRVAMDGAMLPPDANELGWKDTFRVNPLEHTIIAMRPVVPTADQVPFDVPNSVRLIDPTLPEGANLIPPPPAGWFDPAGNQITGNIVNRYVNFGWEYVWHCHILAHEEMDMMHSLVFAVPPRAPSSFTSVRNAGNTANVLNWVDNSLNETGFTIQRATNSSFTAGLTEFNLGPNLTTYTDTVAPGTYFYRIRASNTVGDTQVYAGSPLGFPTKTAVSDYVTQSLPANLGITKTDGATSRGAGPMTYTIVVNNAGPNAVTGATVTDTMPAVLTSVTWSCAASAGSLCTAAAGSGNIATTVNLAVNGAATFTVNATLPTTASGTLTNTATVAPPAGIVDPVLTNNTATDNTTIVQGSTLLAPTNFTAQLVSFGTGADPVLLNWTDNSTGETGYRVQRCTGSTCTNWTTVLALTGTNVVTGTHSADLTSGSTYRYRVAALNGTTVGPYSAIVSVNLGVTPAAPSGLTATQGAIGAPITVSLTWVDNSNNNSSFQGELCTGATEAACPITGGANWGSRATVAGNVTTFVSTGLSATSYRFRIRAVNPQGNSAWNYSNFVVAR